MPFNLNLSVWPCGLSQCILKHVNVSGGDKIFVGCLFDSGFSLTDPGTIAAHGGDEGYRLFMPK